MALTYDRPGATAAELNAAYAAMRGALAPKLPTRIRDRLLDGTETFDTSPLIDLDEDDPDADAVESVDDLPLVMASKASREWQRGLWSAGFDGSVWAVQVRETLRIRPTTAKINGATIAVVTPGASDLSPLHAEVRLVVSGQGYDPVATGYLVASPEGSAPGIVGAFETFEGTGYAAWDPGVETLVGLVEQFAGSGYAAWNPGVETLVGLVESVWSGWAEGLAPVIPTGGSSTTINVVTGDTVSVDLTSQVDGTAMTFTLPDYVSGSLRVYLNGQRLREIEFVETSATSFTLDLSVAVPTPPDALVADYIPCAC